MPPIGTNDTISVIGKHLYTSNGTPFQMKGIAFPVPTDPSYYNATNWINVLDQLHSSLGDGNINTIRLYRTDPSVDYSEFFNAAAERGIYIMVPLTAATGAGDLDRKVAAPHCYPRKLYDFGVASLRNYLEYPNIIAGLVGNEVINTGEAWQAASCVKAYVRDLKDYMAKNVGKKGGLVRELPLIYATQHSALGAGMGVSDAVTITHDYFTCNEELPNVGYFLRSLGEGIFAPGSSSVDIFGVNIESWCSSLDTYESTEKGDKGTYLTLYDDMKDSSVPIIFTEMGCSHTDFNRANRMGDDDDGARDWKQIDVVLNDMSDRFAGFCAYAYWGNPDFAMFKGGPWTGGETSLTPTKDFDNFKKALENHNGTVSDSVTADDMAFSKLCSEVEEELMMRYNIKVLPLKEMPKRGVTWYNGETVRGLMSFGLLALMVVYVRRFMMSNVRTKGYLPIP